MDRARSAAIARGTIIATTLIGEERCESVFQRSMPSDLIRGWIPVRVKKTRQNKK
jgi:hypothetical protein